MQYLRLLMESNSSPEAYLKRMTFSRLNSHPYVRETHWLASLPWKLVLPSEIVYIRISLSTTLPSKRWTISQRTFDDWNEDTHPNEAVLVVVSGRYIQLHWRFRGYLLHWANESLENEVLKLDKFSLPPRQDDHVVDQECEQRDCSLTLSHF